MKESDLVKRFLENRDVILSFIYALTRDYDVAEEIFQNVAVSILQTSGQAVQVDNFLGWAREVARHRVADHYRQSTRRTALIQPSWAMVETVAQAFTENEAAPEANHERMKSLLACLERLTGRSRDVIEGFYRRRQSVRELAATLDWKENSVKVALSRARKQLADCIQLRIARKG